MNASSTRPAPLTPLVSLLALIMVAAGCGGDGVSDELWNDVVRIEWDRTEQAADRPPAEVDRLVAENIDRALQEHPNAPARLRRALEEIRDGKQRLADGDLSGDEADALRDRHEDYWTYLRRREIPPDFR